MNKEQIKFIINTDTNKIYLQNLDKEIILSNEKADYKISRFFRFVAGLCNTFLIYDKSNGEESFKILSFPFFKIKRDKDDYICNPFDVLPMVGYTWNPKKNNYFIDFKFYNEGVIVDLTLFNLHFSGLYITNISKDNLDHSIQLLNSYLYQDKVDIGRQLILQIYNLIYTLTFREKMNILFNNSQLDKYLTTDWNYSFVLFDKIKILSLFCNKYQLDDSKINLTNLAQIKTFLSNNIIPIFILDQAEINKYITKKYLIFNDHKFNLPKLLFLYKNDINIPIELEYQLPELKSKYILNKIAEGTAAISIWELDKEYEENFDLSMYFIYDALFFTKSIYLSKDELSKVKKKPINTKIKLNLSFVRKYPYTISSKYDKTPNPFNLIKSTKNSLKETLDPINKKQTEYYNYFNENLS